MILLIITLIFLNPDASVKSVNHLMENSPSWKVCSSDAETIRLAAKQAPNQKELVVHVKCDYVQKAKE